MQGGDAVRIISAGSREGDEIYPAAIDQLIRSEEEVEPPTFRVEPQGENLGQVLEPFKKFEIGGADAASILMAAGGNLLVRHLDSGLTDTIPVSEATLVAAEWHPEEARNIAFVTTADQRLFTIQLGENQFVSEPIEIPGDPVAMDTSNVNWLGCILYVAQIGEENQAIVWAFACDYLTE